MDIFSAIDSKFWASIMENPWMILIHLMDII
ncbi:TIGR00159 family protein, partial [Streptococcus agalactiae]|nr:TIGR00159 family protein [Streptococcus agalactiae]